MRRQITTPPVGSSYQLNRRSKWAAGLRYWVPTIGSASPGLIPSYAGESQALRGSGVTLEPSALQGMALNNPGSTEYAILDTGVAVPQAAGTLVIWWMPTEALGGVGDKRPVFLVYHASPLRIFGIYWYETLVYSGWYNNGTDDRIAIATYPSTNDWHMLALTWVSGGNTTLWIDGANAGGTGSLTAAWDTSGDQIRIGYDTGESISHAMKFSEFRLYDRVLSGSEIQALNAGPARWELYKEPDHRSISIGPATGHPTMRRFGGSRFTRPVAIGAGGVGVW